MPVIAGDDQRGRHATRLDGIKDASEAGIVAANRRFRIRCAQATRVLARVRLAQPHQHDIRRHFGQHVVREGAHEPVIRLLHGDAPLRHGAEAGDERIHQARRFGKQEVNGRTGALRVEHRHLPRAAAAHADDAPPRRHERLRERGQRRDAPVIDCAQPFEGGAVAGINRGTVATSGR